MIPHLPVFLNILFLLTTAIAVLFFYVASGRSGAVLVLLCAWLAVQGLLGLNGFYTVTDTTPPRFGFALLPPFLIILLFFLIPAGRSRLDRLDLPTLTILHIVRIPVEICLFRLFLFGQAPSIMTFEGGNLDILSGISAPVIYYFCFMRGKEARGLLLLWNILCLVLLANIVVRAVFSAPFAFQRFAFDQPNRALLYFPFVWLPSCVVPLVLLSHLAALRRLIKGKAY